MNEAGNGSVGIASEGSAVTAGPMMMNTYPSGVGGWLKFFVVVHLYIAPIMVVLNILVSWLGYLMMIDDHPELLVTGAIETMALGYLMILGIRAARSLRDIEPRAVQAAKTFLKLSLGWALISILPSLLTDFGATDAMVSWLLRIGSTAVGFAIWYSYFNVSKRVKNTYADCDL